MAIRELETSVQADDQTAFTGEYERWVCWPVSWSGVWSGALAALATALIFGLAGIALGAHLLGPENRVVDWSRFSIGALALSVGGAFLAFALGGWVAARIAGIRRSEPAMLHGAMAWLVAVPMLLLLAGLGAGSFFGGWYSGLAGSPAWAAPSAAPVDRPEPLWPNATADEVSAYRKSLDEYQGSVRKWREETPRATRNAALGAITALLLGLVGSVVGGWFASGEPMNFTYYRTRRSVRSGTHNGPNAGV